MKISTSRFVDITIYKRVRKNIFINLSEGGLYEMGGTIVFYYIPLDCDYAISIFSENRISYIAEITIEEIILLADIQNEGFLKQLHSNVDEEKSNDIIAMICAEKIMNYSKGRCEQELRNGGKIYYTFKRIKYSGAGKDRVKTKICVLEKEFITIPIKPIEVDIWQKENIILNK